MCSGPRRTSEDESGREPLYMKARYGLYIGKNDGPFGYGQFNNNLAEWVNALDCAMDSGGMTVVVVSDFALEVLEQFFPDEQAWEQASKDLPIVKDSPDLKLVPIVVKSQHLLERELYAFKDRSSWDAVHARRLQVLH
jgi:hypothetical protein